MKRSIIIITELNYSPWITNILPQCLQKEMHLVSAIKQTVYQEEGRGLNYRRKNCSNLTAVTPLILLTSYRRSEEKDPCSAQCHGNVNIP